jgi:hypothetical protein
VSAKRILLVGLAVVCVLGSLVASACGGDDPQAKLQMQQALDKIDADIAGLTDLMITDGTAAEVKAVKTSMEPDWQAVVAATAGIKNADAAKAQQVWDDVAAAVDAVDEEADLNTLAGAVMGPVTALQAYVQELRALLGPTSTDTTAPLPASEQSTTSSVAQ